MLLRLEDLDKPREIRGSAERIRATLDAFGFEWDEHPVRQSERLELYEDALAALRKRDLLFECRCSRRLLRDESRHPGTCRDRPPGGSGPAALRVRVESRRILVPDRVQGPIESDMAAVGGDFIVKRRDGIIAYALAVVVDDAAQGVTDVVRGADLLDSTPQQIYLQGLLGLPTPTYAHLPVLVEADGRKLAKSERSVPLDAASATLQLHKVFGLLGLPARPAPRAQSVAEAWRWALEQWDLGRVPRRLSSALPPLRPRFA